MEAPPDPAMAAPGAADARDPESRPLPERSPALDHGAWPEGGIFEGAAFAQAKAMGAPALRELALRWIVATPGTLGDEGAWRIAGHRLSVLHILSLAHADPGEDSAGGDPLGAAVVKWRRNVGSAPMPEQEMRDKVAAAAGFALLYPEELAAHAVDLGQGEMGAELASIAEAAKARACARELGEAVAGPVEAPGGAPRL